MESNYGNSKDIYDYKPFNELMQDLVDTLNDYSDRYEFELEDEKHREYTSKYIKCIDYETGKFVCNIQHDDEGRYADAYHCFMLNFKNSKISGLSEKDNIGVGWVDYECDGEESDDGYLKNITCDVEDDTEEILKALNNICNAFDEGKIEELKTMMTQTRRLSKAEAIAIIKMLMTEHDIGFDDIEADE